MVATVVASVAVAAAVVAATTVVFLQIPLQCCDVVTAATILTILELFP